MDHRNNLVSYMRGNHTAKTLGLVLIFVALGTFFLFFVEDFDKESVVCFIMAVAMFVCGIITVCNAIAERIAKNSEIKKLESAGKIDEVALEFSRATQMFDDQFRMGDNYIFIRSGRFIKYEDISKIYQYVHLTNNVEDRRELRINNTKGRKSVLCKLALRSQDDKRVKNVCAAVLEKNPNVQIGYK